jgi:hypothetical protein
MIDKYDNYIRKLFESYENPVDIRWVDKDNKLIGLFIIDNIVYKIECSLHENDIWSYKFMRHIKDNDFTLQLNDENNKITTLSKMNVLGTIRKGMEYLIINKNPSALIFSALDESTGRKKLYQRFSDEIVKEFKYTQVTFLKDGKQIFILYKNIDLKIVIDVIGDIIFD